MPGAARGPAVQVSRLPQVGAGGARLCAAELGAPPGCVWSVPRVLYQRCISVPPPRQPCQQRTALQGICLSEEKSSFLMHFNNTLKKRLLQVET